MSPGASIPSPLVTKTIGFELLFSDLSTEFEEDEEDIQLGPYGDKNGMDLWTQQQCWNLGLNGIEWRKMGKSFSSSSVSMSSGGSSRGGSSVMEWASMEESELSGGPTGFSLLVYAWRR